MNLYGFAAGDPVNFADPFGLCGNGKGETPCPKGRVYFLGVSGSFIYGAGPTGGAGVILWSPEGPGVYGRGGGGIGGDVGLSAEGGFSTSMPAFKEWSEGGCAAVSVRAVSVGGCVTGNESGKTYSGQVGERAGENGYPVAEHVERTYTGALTVKDAANFVRKRLVDAEAALNAAMNEAVRRMYYPNQD